MAKFIHFNSIYRVNFANLNSPEGGGNQIPLKKIATFHGDQFVYVSGQAFRRYLRETMYWLSNGEFNICGIDKNGSPIIKTADGKLVIENKKIKNENLKKQGYKGIMKFIIENFPELDIFGFLLAISEKEVGHLRRTSPFQTTALISSFPYNVNNTDMMTRSKAEGQKGDIVKIEIDAFNYLQSAQIINLDLVGSYWDEKEEKLIHINKLEEKKKRLNLLIDALQNTMGGAKKARLLNDLSPKFVVASVQNTGVPYFSYAIDIKPPEKKDKEFSDIKGTIDLSAFDDSFQESKDFIDKIYVGIMDSAFKNSEEINNALHNSKYKNKVKFCSTVSEVFNKVKHHIG